MPATQPYWQNYWYVLHFREQRAAAFEPMGPGGPQQVPNKWLATTSLEQYVEGFLEQATEDLDDLRGELRMMVYTEATPGPNSKPVLERTVQLGRR